MRQHFLSITLLIGGALLTVGCQPAIEPSDLSTAQPIAPEANTYSSPSIGTAIANFQTSIAVQTKLPAIAKLTRIEQGDLQCYLSFTDSHNQTFDIGGSFDICTEQYLNQTVQITYELSNINDCQSNEPCGKTKEVTLVTQLQLANSQQTTPSSTTPPNSTTYQNSNWTVTISNSDSWSGVNGTGDSHYRGCDANGNCLELMGGTTTCRDGQCVTGWRNGNFSYALISQITENAGDGKVQLLVREGDTAIVDETLQLR